jgi:D-alanyl-D-alanine carboxypeptidase
MDVSAALQSALEAAAARQHAVGVSAAVRIPGQGHWEGAVGLADPGGTRMVTTDTTFAIASVTKTFVASLVLRLAERRQLNLDDRLAEWISLPSSIDPGVTLRQALNQTSGIGDYVANRDLAESARSRPDHAFTPQELVAAIGPQDFAPGHDWAYSNANYLLLGLVVEAVTTRQFARVLHDELLGPLGLTSAVYQPTERPHPPLADGSSFFSRGSTADGSGLLPNLGGATLAATAGGMAATARDIAAWGDALYGGAVLAPASLEAMFTFVPATGNGLYAYGLGVSRRIVGGVESDGHNGRTLGYASGLAYLRTSGITIAVLANADGLDIDAIAGALADVALPLRNG